MKRAHFDTLIFAKLGKFYEMYCRDAQVQRGRPAPPRHKPGAHLPPLVCCEGVYSRDMGRGNSRAAGGE